MTITHHLSDQLLIAYAAGSLPEAFSLVAATHVSLCDDCRIRIEAYEAIGGAVLETETAEMGEASLEACLARLGQPDTPHRPAPRRGLLPSPLADYVGGDLDKVRWRSLGMGVRQAILPTAKGASARLLYIPAGQGVPDHGHRGLELTLVLQGAFHDARARFGPGDVEIADESDEHTPVAETGDACICLAATDAPLRFISLLPRLLQPIFRI
ncbi:ChrR family anti-sigma-E factor [Tabrizicola oligotrophica]|uniref:Transcriptional regulator n=1 Tax=Tabrizicola oligotrophica TaxID=2710650 RepID=A0A6M0QR39_9RHOB|nr:ChrR family anti-sigma-E factor [Tabrizicola oligotrophica]NEY89970.1 transcriptional regulator [Tabrizicola oligotrophica]